MAQISNFLLSNKIRDDTVIVSNEIEKELVELSRFTGGVAVFAEKFNDGIEFFNKEEFFNVDLRNFDDFHSADLTADNFKSLKKLSISDLDSEIKIKTSEFADESKFVTSPKFAVSECNKEMKIQMANKGENSLHFAHPSQKRIINELKIIINESNGDVKVFPLKDRVDFWRVLIKGFEDSLYKEYWFYLMIEFPPEYPQHYPLFRKNNKNGEKNPDEWENHWKIQPDGDDLILNDINVKVVPDQFLDPISRKIMKEPVKATSGVYYEKRELKDI